MDAFRDLIDKTSWPHWRKDEFVRAVEALAEAQLVTEAAIALPGDAGFRERFAAAFIVFAKC
ncbi:MULTISPECIES: hypothetical protein [Bradyrhizobium]|uniref:Uncharacterized protein n=1 Tax=Bradyrhizobium barranii subsp. barranii TaxID=2823807 RepID=A0A939S7Q3_9BRAD|nr:MULTISPECIES: hypothetical protein [Bradyrhizobium]WLB96411.1 hypothetical protein QIH92_43755 [Bradyrhizobium japonicum USDA 123]MBR0884845.1 hypothetical protein [Bradyrhizobium liaoningense]MBR0947610.1 hypothetical protein [Bradyrhizobium liaoningense]MBR1005225.1 hypothetical protein [Bradyrhizobium liaoningense]MBR1033507.1 hypothetical protein [Bradyrhizobium liaoningense]